MTKRIAVIGVLFVLVIAGSAWACQPQPVQDRSEGLLDVIWDAATAPCQVLGACLGSEGPQQSCIAPVPCRVVCVTPVCMPPCVPVAVRPTRPCVELRSQYIQHVTTASVRYVVIPERLSGIPSKNREIRLVSAPPAEQPRVPDLHPAVPRTSPPDRALVPREPLPEVTDQTLRPSQPAAPQTSIPEKPRRYNEVKTVPSPPVALPPRTEIPKQVQTSPVVPPKPAAPEQVSPTLPAPAPPQEKKTVKQEIRTEEKRPETKIEQKKPELKPVVGTPQPKPEPKPVVQTPKPEIQPKAPQGEIKVEEKKPKKKQPASPPCGSWYPMPRCY
jgi:hypothetical protein